MPRHDLIPIAECPADVLEQIAHAGDCAITKGRAPRYRNASTSMTARWLVVGSIVGGSRRDSWRRAARWAARKLGVEVR